MCSVHHSKSGKFAAVCRTGTLVLRLAYRHLSRHARGTRKRETCDPVHKVIRCENKDRDLQKDSFIKVNPNEVITVKTAQTAKICDTF